MSHATVGRASRLALAIAVSMVFATCRGGDSPGKRVIVLGFDGMDYRLTRELMSKGRMPNFSEIASSGTFAPLATTIPPQSPVAWSSFTTGLDPGGHGIFDFIHREAKTLTPFLSTTKTATAEWALKVGGWQFPISPARVELLREGQPFWDVLEQRGVRTTIIRMPANFPPSGSASREVSGMGTPDILGTYGTFSFFSSAPGPLAGRTLSGGRLYTTDVVDNVVRAELVGPANPFRTAPQSVRAPFTVFIDARESVAKIAIGDEERVLKVGEWSDWVPVEFPLIPLQRLRGICRFYLKQVRPAFELYVSPINLDPADPVMPISTPASFAAELARATGPFYTQGIAEETKGLNEHVLTRPEFLQQAALVADGITRQYWHVLEGFSDGLLFYYFGNLDQVSHMMWRARDPEHPAYNPVADAPYASVVEELYVASDRIVGDTLRRMRPDDTLIVMSDHGFTSWRRSFHLNSWLRDNGFLAVLDPTLKEDPGVFNNVDWSRTQAYGLGLNGLYVNLRGREAYGIVSLQDRARLVDEIARGLVRVIDPTTGRPAVSKVYRREEAYPRTSHADVAPDLIVGYAEGTRVSNESALGGLPPSVITDNTDEWSGDHTMNPEAVPGILLTSRPLKRTATSLQSLAASLLSEFGIEEFPVAR